MLTSRKHAPSHLGRVLILGLGKSGRAAAGYVSRLVGGRVDAVAVAAGAHSEEAYAFARTIECEDVRVLFDHYEIEGHYDLCIASPGISSSSAFYQSAASACGEVISEVEFAWRESACGARWVAVTGTNGKTTTTALIAQVLTACKVKAAAVGNIGETCIDAVAQGGVDVFVAEVSSYQLASTVRFAPDVAVILNIAPDHLHWHNTFEAYEEAKLKVLDNLAGVPNATAILGATCPVLRKTVRRLRAQPAAERGFAYLPLGGAEGLGVDMRKACGADNAAYVRDGVLCVSLAGTVHPCIAAGDLLVKGEHNTENALAAAAAAVVLGCDDGCIAQGLASFQPLPHRIEFAGSVAGVACYNDSKATNVDATIKALTAFPDKPLIVLLGGEDKGTGLDALVAAVGERCKGAVCFGAAAPRFLEAFDGCPVPVYGAATLAAALDEALAHARAGDVVILSPACASFDEFVSFEHRGDTFKELVAQHAGARGR